MAEDDFGHPHTERAVMVNFSEPQVFKWKMAQFSDSFVGRELSGADFLEKLADGFGVHGSESKRRQFTGVGWAGAGCTATFSSAD